MLERIVIEELVGAKLTAGTTSLSNLLGDVKEDYWLGTEQFRDFLLTMFNEKVVNPIFEGA